VRNWSARVGASRRAGEAAEVPDRFCLLSLGFVGGDASKNRLSEVIHILLQLVDGAPCSKRIDLGGKVGVAVMVFGFRAETVEISYFEL
jgi:hypothetical protein